MLIAMMLEIVLTGLGCDVTITTRVAKAADVAATEDFDAAILDLNLNGETSYPVANILQRRGVPFAFLTSDTTAGLSEDYTDSSILHKPIRRKISPG